MDDGRASPALERDHHQAETDDAVPGSGATVYSAAEARAVVRRVAEATASMDADAFADGHTEDCIVRLIGGPPLVGRQAVRDYMAPRLTPDRSGYTRERTLRVLNGNVFGVQWTTSWTERATGRAQPSSAATPGRVLPSSHSRKAPPAAET